MEKHRSAIRSNGSSNAIRRKVTFRRRFQGQKEGEVKNANLFRTANVSRKVGRNPITSRASRSENVRLRSIPRKEDVWWLRKSNEMETPTRKSN
ncbi:hypothetical protein CDAR_471121 [Caerostris darwini]|uniref:Uncharacterized protein n=1 Tax=Caerostris darwini TaxID=1538125 RepID=A0AAV4QQ75_9ARAC|nr:hypothetical protein CDAR_471121 [Caerostris darwini]